MMANTEQHDIKKDIQERYGAAAERIVAGEKASCCGAKTSCCEDKKTFEWGSTDPICRDLYDESQGAELPEEALLASFGCGNPTALAELEAGETVLDLGSGGGIDVLLSARRVGPTGKAYGLDMTDAMLELAERNKRKAGADNVEFLRGSIEEIPLPDASVDVIISNCVINLSTDKRRVLKEAFRVLKPGGRFAVSDMVLEQPLPDDVRASINLWSGCVAGALVQADYLEYLKEAGFCEASIERTRSYTLEEARAMAGQGEEGEPSPQALQAMASSVSSAFIRAHKPRKPCCCGG